MLKGGLNTGSMTKPHGINVSSSVYGKAVKLVYGMTQVSPDLIWYNDWKSASHPSNSNLAAVTGTGGGKKKVTKKAGVKYYSAALNLLLGHAPMRGVMSIWFNNQKFAVVPCSASGFISGGAFSFTPVAGNSKVTITGTVPASGPYTVTAPNFVSDLNLVKVAGKFRQPAVSPPGIGQYSVTTGGVYEFNLADAGLAYSITYRKLTSGSAATLAGVYACTIAENFSETFNDYGGTGSVTAYGTWDRPLWNSSFPVPGRVDAGAYTARDPYSFSWDGVSNSVSFPSALNGYPVTVYYGVPAIYKSDGTFFSSTLTPMALLNLEFEQVMGSGSEYSHHPDQQIVQSWASGIGSIQFDLGPGNAMANMNMETIGAFTQHPNGDCDVRDIIADIIYSGPVLV
jgi:hypothetical protein